MQIEKLTPEQALKLLDDNLSQLNGSRQAHLTLMAAVGVLREALEALALLTATTQPTTAAAEASSPQALHAVE
jgi:high-affinity Fe2+/Pb2+ permease